MCGQDRNNYSAGDGSGSVYSCRRPDERVYEKDGDTKVYVDVKCGEEQEQKHAQIKGMIGEFAADMDADNATMEALKTYFKPDTLTKIKKAEKVFAFSSKTKYSGIISEGKVM